MKQYRFVKYGIGSGITRFVDDFTAPIREDMIDHIRKQVTYIKDNPGVQQVVVDAGGIDFDIAKVEADAVDGFEFRGYEAVHIDKWDVLYRVESKYDSGDFAEYKIEGIIEE